MKKLSLIILISSIAISLSDEKCPLEPDNYDDELEDCNEMTPNQGNYCCLLDYDLQIGVEGKGTSCIEITNDEYKERDKALTRLRTDNEDYKDATGKIICKGDSTSSSSFTFINHAKSLLSLILLLI